MPGRVASGSGFRNAEQWAKVTATREAPGLIIRGLHKRTDDRKRLSWAGPVYRFPPAIAERAGVTKRDWDRARREQQAKRRDPDQDLGPAKGSRRRDDSPRLSPGKAGKRSVLPWETPVVGRRQRRTDNGM